MLKNIDCTAVEGEIKSTLSGKRFEHSLGVAQTCLKLNDAYQLGLDESLARSTGLLHDLVREWPHQALESYAKEHQLSLFSEERQHPVLLHAPVGASVLRERGYPEQLCTAIRFHTLGSVEMGLLGLVLYIADYLEPGRSHLDAGQRSQLWACATLEDLALEILQREHAYLLSKGKSVSESSLGLQSFLQAGGKL